jgi:repressor LexA
MLSGVSNAMSKDLTNRQRLVLEYVISYIGSHGYSPAIRDIGEGLGIRYVRGVTSHLDALERKGFIRRETASRSIQVLKIPADMEANGFKSLPVLGTIAAGLPLLAVESIEGEMTVPKSLFGTAENAFLLRVRGDSMIDAHIADGDVVVIKPQQTAENGDLVAARIGDEATVKRLRIDDHGAMLVPANPAYLPIELRGTDAGLIGKVIGLLRMY